MKSAFEKVLPVAGISWSYLDRRLQDGIPFEWHHHPEYELTLTLNSVGHRYVGDSIEPYGHGDLVLLGSNIPHSWHSERSLDSSNPHRALVCWFDDAWIERLIAQFPELHRIKELAERAGCGVVFGEQAALIAGSMLAHFSEMSDDARSIQLLAVLQRLSRDENMRLISPSSQTFDVGREPRLDGVLSYLHEHYAESVSIETLASMACVSDSAFHRMFRRHMQATPLAYVARLRIGRACALLIEGKLKISAIADVVGYESLAQFNKEFRKQKGMTPREFGAKF